MTTRNASANWKGSLKNGNGTLDVADTEFSYSYPSRFEEGDGTNPEELIAAASAGCFSMALAGSLAAKGYEVRNIDTTAGVRLTQKDGDFAIDKITLNTRASIGEIDNGEFQEIAESAKKNCPVSKALGSVGNIELNAELTS